MVHSIMHKQTPINSCHYFNLNINTTRSHPLTLRTRSSSINAFRYSFYMNTPFVWNSIPYEICPYRHAYLDHGSDVTCLTDVSHLLLIFVFVRL